LSIIDDSPVSLFVKKIERFALHQLKAKSFLIAVLSIQGYTVLNDLACDVVPFDIARVLFFGCMRDLQEPMVVIASQSPQSGHWANVAYRDSIDPLAVAR
jgi:hypothetical protein